MPRSFPKARVGKLEAWNTEEPMKTVWVFGYGSLMWDRWETPLGGRRVDHAVLLGYRRAFNKRSVENWGTREFPAATLGLEPVVGARCVGSAFEFAEEQRVTVVTSLKGREGKSFALPELPVLLPDGREVRALTPVNATSGPTYIGQIPIADRARMAAAARGTSGACADYVREIKEKLDSLGITDEAVEGFVAHLKSEQARKS